MQCASLVEKQKLKTDGVIKGTLSMTISTVIVKLLGVIYKVPLSTILGEVGMGYFNSAYTVYGMFFILCTAGVPKAITLVMSQDEMKGGELGAERIVRVSMLVFLVLGVLVSGAFIVLAKPIAELIGSKPAYATMLAVAPSIVFVSLTGVMRGVLGARLKFGAIAVSQIIEGAGKLVLGLIFADRAARLGLPVYIVSSLTILGVTLGSLAGTLFLMVCVKREKDGNISGRNCKSRNGIKIIKRVFSTSLPITAGAAVMSITNVVDLGVVMRRLSDIGYTELTVTAIYGNYTTVAVPMFNLIVAVIAPISTIFLPVFSRAHIKNNRLLLDSSIYNAMLISNFLAFPLGMGISLFSIQIILLLFKGINVGLAVELLHALMPSVVFIVPLTIANTLLEACGKIGAPIVSMSLGGIVKLFLSYVLVGNANVGILGAPISTFASYATSMIVSAVIVKKKCGCNVLNLRSFILPFVCSTAALVPAVIIHHRLFEWLNSDIALFASVSISVALYLIFSVLSGIITPKRIKEMSTYTN